MAFAGTFVVVAASEIGADGVYPFDAFDIGGTQISSSEVGAIGICRGQISIGQPCTREPHANQLCLRKIGACQIRVVKTRVVEVVAGEELVREITPMKIRATGADGAVWRWQR